MESYYIATFYSVSQALRFEKALLLQDMAVEMIPVPRVLSSSCGIAARFSEDVYLKLVQLALDGYVTLEGVYHFVHQDKTPQILACSGPWDEINNE